MNKCHIYTTRIGLFLTRKFLQCSKLLKMKGFLWQGRRGSNSQHPVLETGALPIELRPYWYQ